MSCDNEIKTVKVKKVHVDAQLPFYATSGAAAADVHAVNNCTVVINPGEAAIFDTGLQFEVPVGYQLKAYSRSGHGFKSGIRLSNCTGILDSDYRGNLMVRLHNDSDTPYVVQPFERVCQIQIQKAPQHRFVETIELSDTERGVNGFGSTGKVVTVMHSA